MRNFTATRFYSKCEKKWPKFSFEFSQKCCLWQFQNLVTYYEWLANSVAIKVNKQVHVEF